MCAHVVDGCHVGGEGWEFFMEEVGNGMGGALKCIKRACGGWVRDVGGPRSLELSSSCFHIPRKRLSNSKLVPIQI